MKKHNSAIKAIEMQLNDSLDAKSQLEKQNTKLIDEIEKFKREKYEANEDTFEMSET
jgi:hypothetical protein